MKVNIKFENLIKNLILIKTNLEILKKQESKEIVTKRNYSIN